MVALLGGRRGASPRPRYPMRYLSTGVPLSAWIASMALLHCAGSSNDAASFGPRGQEGANATVGGGSGTTGSGTGSGGSGGGVLPPPPPEIEVEKAFEAPVATERFVWAANPKTGRVALIDSNNYQVKTVAAGQGPTFLAAIPGKDDRAIVLNVFSNDATYFVQNVDGALDRKTFQVAPRANAWSISPNSRLAISWTDVSRVKRPDSIEGFQQISIIDLQTTDAVTRAPVRTVGFRPSSISFSADSGRAFAVTEDGITVIDLSTTADPKVARTIKLDVGATDPSADAGTDTGTASDAAAPDAFTEDSGRPEGGAEAGSAISEPPIAKGKADVSITPSGQFAVVRREGSDLVTVINLADATRWSWKLSGPVTDLDLADTGDRAVAVVRSESHAAILPVPGTASAAFDDVLIGGETVGSVVLAPKGNTALLYTNAAAVNRLTVLQLFGAPKYDIVDLHAPVLSVFASPTAEHAIVIHNTQDGKAFQSAGAFSVVPLSGEQAPVIQPTDAPPLSVAIAPAGDRALVPVRDDQKKIYGVYLAHMPSLVTERFPLASPPMSAGFVGSAGQAFIAQEHPQGRVTFIDATSGLVRTITGFELGASVVVWSRDGGQ
jgi:hypothetical protein